MRDFNNLEAVRKVDPQDTIGSTNLAVQQMETAWNEVSQLSFSQDYKHIQNAVFCGMGASIYGALVLKALLGRTMPFPYEVVSDYFLPEYVGENTLVVLTSYSGTTEEVLSCAEDAKAKNAKIIVLTKGGPLAEFARDNNLPAYIFDGKLNPAGTPRLGNGYTVIGLIGLLNKIKVIDIEDKEIENAIARLKENFEDLRKQAIADVSIFYNKIPIIFAAEHLAGNGQIFRNQFNETSKAFSAYYLVPDLNHHLMEGLQFPKDSKLQFVVLNSPNYSEKIKKRMALTMDVVRQNGHEVYEVMASGATVYDDFLEVLQYGSFLTLYLALAYDQNPAINPWVDYFKAKLAQGDSK
jgi:glucose/mannose-6-phosphate isomerase